MQVREAYEVLIDPSRRMDYDIRNDGLFAWERGHPDHSCDMRTRPGSLQPPYRLAPLPLYECTRACAHSLIRPARTRWLVHSAEQYAVVALACILAFLLSRTCCMWMQDSGAH
jgi:hypothetical protein